MLTIGKKKGRNDAIMFVSGQSKNKKKQKIETIAQHQQIVCDRPLLNAKLIQEGSSCVCQSYGWQCACNCVHRLA